MPLAAGTRLGVFEILAPLGKGGMGEVYRAKDTKLEREVAVKILPEEMAKRPERMARFEREAKLLAALDHPHIAAIHGLHEEDGHHFLVMELVEGKTLAEHLDQGALSVQDGLQVGREIAEALEAAHAKGIIHRDLKPSNVVLTEAGRAKLLDFGLGKALEDEPASSAVDTATIPDATREGTVLGTAPYMSPEQARGDDVDYRSDIWSFGCLFYEAMTGKRAFPGRTSSDALAAVLVSEPDWECLPDEFPPALLSLLQRCLQKDKQRRLHDIVDARIEIQEAQQEPTGDRRSTMRRWAPSPRRKLLLWIGGVATATAIVAGWAMRRDSQSPTAAEKKMIVVLPFENLGAPDKAHFATGMTEEIRSHLAAVGDLRVISRRSAVHYGQSNKTLKQIGTELGVDYVLDGTVRWEQRTDGERIRVTPQLTKVSDDTQLWTERYDRSPDEVFAVQSAIAVAVVERLNVTLLEQERATIEVRPTENLEAYQAYQRGMVHYDDPDYEKDSFELAILMFERAVQLDPHFVAALARLSMAHSDMYWHDYDPTEGRLAQARAAADRAMALAPDSPEVHRALSLYYYHGVRDYDRALEEARVAAARLSNDGDLQLTIAAVLRRQGRFDESLDHFERALRLNPRDSKLWWDTGATYAFLRRYDEGDRYFGQSIALAPDQWQAYYHRVLYSRAAGSLEQARAALQSFPKKNHPRYLAQLWMQELYERRDFEAALDRLEAAPALFGDDHSIYACQLRILMEDPEGAMGPCEAARRIAEAQIQERPAHRGPYWGLAFAHAGLGEEDKAVAAAKRAIELSPLSENAYMFGFWPQYNLATTYSLIGDSENALDQIEYMLSLPGGISVQWLRVNVDFDPLRSHPRFQKLLERAE